MSVPLSTHVPLRARDLDVVGHVHQGVYHDLLEEGRSTLLAADAAQIGYPFVLAHVDIDHRAELRRADGAAEVRTAVERVGARSVVVAQEVRAPDGRTCAQARSVLVAFDEGTRSARALDAEERARLAPATGDAHPEPPARVVLAGGPAPVRTVATLRWRDMNPMGHMDQGRFQELLDDARAAVFVASTGPLGFPFVLARLEADFHAEVARADDRLLVDTWVERTGERSVTLAHRMTSTAGEPVLSARSVMVAFDRATRRSRPLTEAERGLRRGAFALHPDALAVNSRVPARTAELGTGM